MYSVTVPNTAETRDALHALGFNMSYISEYKNMKYVSVQLYARSVTLTYGFTKDRPHVDIDTLVEILLINDVKASLLHMEVKGLLTREDMKEMVILEHHHPYPEDFK